MPKIYRDSRYPACTYRVERQYEGLYYVLDEKNERCTSVGRFMPGPMVSVDGPRIVPPALARAIADAMNALAAELEGDDEPEHCGSDDIDEQGFCRSCGEDVSHTRDRLEYLRGELRAERISLGELAELASLAEYIEPGDVELLEAAGVPESPGRSIVHRR